MSAFLMLWFFGRCSFLLSVLRLENGMDSSLSRQEEWQDKLDEEDEDDWNEDDYDVEMVYVRD